MVEKARPKLWCRELPGAAAIKGERESACAAEREGAYGEEGVEGRLIGYIAPTGVGDDEAGAPRGALVGGLPDLAVGGGQEPGLIGVEGDAVDGRSRVQGRWRDGVQGDSTITAELDGGRAKHQTVQGVIDLHLADRFGNKGVGSSPSAAEVGGHEDSSSPSCDDEPIGIVDVTRHVSQGEVQAGAHLSPRRATVL